ncbi:MAG: sulfatase [Kiritimatiellia bacterium]|nr:sulfatase [Kiritimatiellia bacterium]
MKPNILYIHSHDTGRYIQPYGHAVPTPNLQCLAKAGALFRQAFTASPTCSPSRACLLTGEYPHSNGMLGLAHRGFSLNDYSKHLLHTLRKHGYHSTLSGVQHIAHGPDAWRTIGYDRHLGETKEAEIKAVEFLRERPATPFLLDVGFSETHRPFPKDCGSHDPRYCLPPAPLPDTPETRLDMAQFKHSAEILDTKIGLVLNALEESGLVPNTLVICTTDHGIAFPRMKCNLEDSGTGIMLIMRGPGGFLGGKIIDGMVSQIDIFPSICEMLGIEAPERLQGVSFMPLVNGGRTVVRDSLFFEINYHAAYEPMRAVRTTRFKYIRRYDPRHSPVLPNCDASPSKSVWLEGGWKCIAPEDEALYDLLFDPNERCNLAAKPSHRRTLEDMRTLLHREMKATRDPLLDGDLPLPPTARLDARDNVDPRHP